VDPEPEIYAGHNQAADQGRDCKDRITRPAWNIKVTAQQNTIPWVSGLLCVHSIGIRKPICPMIRMHKFNCLKKRAELLKMSLTRGTV